MPYGPLVRPAPLGNLPGTVVLQVVAPQFGGTSALVSFPGAELAIYWCKAELRPVGGVGGKAAVDNGKGLLETSLQGDGEVAAIAFTKCTAVGPKEDVAAVGCPVEHHMIKPTPGGHFTHGVVKGELPGRAPL